MSTTRIAAVSLLALCGCATQGTSSYDYTSDKPTTIRNEKVVPRPQAVVWDQLVRELSKSFYVINNIERESRIINVSFNSNSPADYVDCGRTRRTYQQGSDTETFDYAVAESSKYKAAVRRTDTTFSEFAIVDRHTTLEGRANIYVAPDSADPGKTTVSVNTRYIFTSNIVGQLFLQNMYGQVIRAAPIPPQNPLNVIFNTNKPTSVVDAGQTITCFDSGKLESEILDMVR